MRVPIPDSSWLLQVAPTAVPTQEPLTYKQPVDTLPIVSDTRWSAGFTDHSVTALCVWIILLIVLQMAVWPITKRLFAQFPDRGWGFSRLLALLSAAFIVWFPAALGITYFRAIWCWLAIVVIAAGAWIWQRRYPSGDTQADRSARSLFSGTEIVFWVVFSFFLLLRLINPDSYEPIWGGEKAMEFAHINSILRSAQFPPVDPWYAGGFLNYYYYGSYIVAFMIKLTGIPGEIAFNLALPTVMAMLATGVFSIGLAIGKSLGTLRRIQYLTAIAATIFTVGIGNLVDAARTWQSLTTNEPRYLWDYWVWGATRIFSDAETGKYGITEFPYFSALYGDLHAHLIALPITVLVIGLVYALWLEYREREIVPDSPAALLTVLRPLAGPCLLLGMILGSLFMTNAWDTPTYGVVCGIGLLAAFTRTRPLGMRMLLTAITVLVIAITAYIATFAFNQHYVALFSSIGEVSEKTSLLPVEAHWGIFILILTAGYASVGLHRPKSGQSLIDPWLLVPFLVFLLCIRWYAVQQSQTLRDLADAAAVLVVAFVWLATTWFVIDDEGDFAISGHFLRFFTLAAACVVIAALISGRPVLALYGVIGISSGIAWLASPGRAERFLYGLIACAMLLGAALELVYLVDDLSTTTAYRMNSVFKFYNQMWVLLAIATAGFVTRMALQGAGKTTPDVPIRPETASNDADTIATESETPPDRAGESASPRQDPAIPSLIARRWARTGLVVTAVMTLLGFAYPVQATIPRLDTRFPHPGNNLTLDAYAWMNYAEMPFLNAPPVTYADDLAAIDWFNTQVQGHPVIAEAAFGTYRCNGSRFSIATGLPAVIGWERHEQQQRDRTLLPQRVQDMRQLYSSSDPAIKRELIAKYGIDYIIVGQTERIYPQIQGNDCLATDISAGIAAIEQMVGTDLEVAYTHGTTTVYRVVHPGT